MTDTVAKAIDARQFPQWSTFLKNIGWQVKKLKGNNIAIKKIPFINLSIIKIQHPLNPVPFKQVDIIAKKYNALLVLVEPHNHKYNEEIFIKNGYKRSNMRAAHSATIRIDLQKTEEEIFNSFSENAKRNIKKAKKNNLRVEIIRLNTKESEKYFLKFYNLLGNLVKMKKFYIPKYKESYAKFQGFKNNSVLLFAYENNKDNSHQDPIAGIWLGYYKNVSVYLQTGIMQKGYLLLANYLLVWKALQFSKKNNIQVFDFESIYDTRYPKDNKDWIGYSEFKKRFHGEIIEYPHNWIKIYNPLLKIISIFVK